MARQSIDPEPLSSFLEKEKIASLEQLKQALQTTGTMTVFRKLQRLGYRSSYSHRGRFYTLQDLAQFDEWGLWSYHSVWFSKYGNLIETALEFVQESTDGYTVAELEDLLHVQCKAALLKLYQQKRVEREIWSEGYVYFSVNVARGDSQRLARKEAAVDLEGRHGARITHELKAAILLFHSLLDEKQRRLHAGLEAYKLGHGGDGQIAALLGIDRHTVAKGRREILGTDTGQAGIRKAGGGRKAQEKKHPKSSKESKLSCLSCIT